MTLGISLRSTLLLLVAVTLSSACGGLRAKTDGTLGELGRTSYPTLVMTEPEFNFDHTPAELYIRTLAVVNELVIEHDLPVYAPWEADIEVGQQWPHGRELFTEVVASNGLDSDNVLMLVLRITQDGTERVVRQPADFGGGTELSYTPDVSVELVVRHANGGGDLFAVNVEFKEDVYAIPDEDDAEIERPMLQNAIAVAADALALEFEETFVRDTPGTGIDPQGVYNGKQIFDFGAGAGLPLSIEWSQLDPLELRLVHFDWLRRVEPRLTAEDAEFFETVEPGVLLESVSGQMQSAGVRVGDYVVGVNGNRALGLHTIERGFLLTGPGDAVRMDVLRNGQVQRFYVER